MNIIIGGVGTSLPPGYGPGDAIIAMASWHYVLLHFVFLIALWLPDMMFVLSHHVVVGYI